jgi:DNA repair protein RadC
MTSYEIGKYRITMVRESVDTEPGPALSTPDAVGSVLHAFLQPERLDREHFVVVLLDVRHHLIGIHTVSVGALTGSLVHPREVFKPAILGSAAGVVIAHNHPSGDPEPSAEDIAITRRMAAAGTLLGIEVVDHLVLGFCGKFVSLKTRGVL